MVPSRCATLNEKPSYKLTMIMRLEKVMVPYEHRYYLRIKWVNFTLYNFQIINIFFTHFIIMRCFHLGLHKVVSIPVRCHVSLGDRVVGALPGLSLAPFPDIPLPSHSHHLYHVQFHIDYALPIVAFSPCILLTFFSARLFDIHQKRTVLGS